MQILLRASQQRSFGEDISRLSSGKRLSNSSRLLKLDPFLDEAGLLRVGERLERGSCAYDLKHPVILLSHDSLTSLMID